MSPTQAIEAEPDPTAPFRRAINALLNVGVDLFNRALAAIAHNSTAHLPKRFARDPVAAERRIDRTLGWIHALARTLAGDRTWHLVPTYILPSFAGRFPPLTAELRKEIGLPPVPPPTQAQKDAAHRRYIAKVFATQPVSRIAKRLARRLGIAEASDFWPRELLAITETPIAWAKRAHAKPTLPTPPQHSAPHAETPPILAAPPKIPTTGPP